MTMSKTVWAFGALVAASLAIAGCQEPYQIVSAPVPGQDLRSNQDFKDADPAQAIGETGGSSAGNRKAKSAPEAPLALPTAKGEVKTTASGVKYETVKEGKGAVARPGQRVSVHYVGTLDNGKKFDSSRDRGTPISKEIGAAEFIKGWDEAIPGMRIGEVRKLTVPPSAGYGASGKGAIPPNATLHFEIELTDVK